MNKNKRSIVSDMMNITCQVLGIAKRIAGLENDGNDSRVEYTTFSYMGCI